MVPHEWCPGNGMTGEPESRNGRKSFDGLRSEGDLGRLTDEEPLRKEQMEDIFFNLNTVEIIRTS